MEEHKRAETEKDLFGEVRLGFLVPEALDLDMATEDMAAFLRLIVSCGRRKKILSARAVEYLSKLLQSRRWQRVLHSDLELMNQLNSFVEEYPEAKKSLDLSELGPPVDSGAARPALPATLDEETARLIQQPLDAGLQGMAKCSWRFSGDADAEAFKQFKQGINRLSNTALAKEAKLAGAFSRAACWERWVGLRVWSA
ncbi:unnamed protein product [Effrenium voratum]|uniref:Uncharacterized protein n=1 Tax=Effrenium voratum TaxID=2562239 RepID=A0AA36IFH8_9DINO|nr:unnamed protein product [Effrenium voratum]